MLNFNGLSIVMIVVLVGAVVLGLSLAGTFSQTEVAKAEGISLQNPIDAERSKFNLEQDKQIQEAKTQDQINQINENARYTRALDDQHLEQSARDFELTSTLKSVLVYGAVAVMIIVALGGTIVLVRRGWMARTQMAAVHQATIANGQISTAIYAMQDEMIQLRESVEQLAQQALAENSREGLLYKGVGQINSRLDALENELTRATHGFPHVAEQIMELKLMLAQLQARGNGSGANDKVIPFKNAA